MRCSANYHCTLDEVAAAHYDLAEAITCCPAGEGAARERGRRVPRSMERVAGHLLRSFKVFKCEAISA